MPHASFIDDMPPISHDPTLPPFLSLSPSVSISAVHSLPLSYSSARSHHCGAYACVAVCRSVLQYAAVCCSVLQYGTVWCSMVQRDAGWCSVVHCGAVCCSVLQCVAVRCSVVQCNLGVRLRRTGIVFLSRSLARSLALCLSHIFIDYT